MAIYSRRKVAGIEHSHPMQRALFIAAQTLANAAEIAKRGIV